jgi:hypothetical protein
VKNHHSHLTSIAPMMTGANGRALTDRVPASDRRSSLLTQ